LNQDLEEISEIPFSGRELARVVDVGIPDIKLVDRLGLDVLEFVHGGIDDEIKGRTQEKFVKQSRDRRYSKDISSLFSQVRKSINFSFSLHLSQYKVSVLSPEIMGQWVRKNLLGYS